VTGVLSCEPTTDATTDSEGEGRWGVNGGSGDGGLGGWVVSGGRDGACVGGEFCTLLNV
jgi:hypothetical protein